MSITEIPMRLSLCQRLHLQVCIWCYYFAESCIGREVAGRTFICLRVIEFWRFSRRNLISVLGSKLPMNKTTISSGILENEWPE